MGISSSETCSNIIPDVKFQPLLSRWIRKEYVSRAITLAGRVIFSELLSQACLFLRVQKPVTGCRDLLMGEAAWDPQTSGAMGATPHDKELTIFPAIQSFPPPQATWLPSSWPGIKPRPPAVEAQSPNHWTTGNSHLILLWETSLALSWPAQLERRACRCDKEGPDYGRASVCLWIPDVAPYPPLLT